MAGLLDGLQGGGSYPQVAPTGRNLWDLLRDAVSVDPSQYAAGDAAAAAEAQRFAAAQRQADANAATALTPQAAKPAFGTGATPYAMGTPDPLAQAPLPGSGAPMGFGAPDASGAATAGAAPAPTKRAAAPSTVASPQLQGQIKSLPLAPLQQADGGAPPVASGVTLNDDGSDPTQDPQGAVQGAASDTTAQLAQAAQSPEASKSVLQGFADQAQGIADKLTNLSPNASQALIATGLATLAANDGSRNLGQVVGIGGAAGLNNYMTNTQMQAKNSLAAAKLQQEQYLELRKQALEEYKARNTPTVVKPGEGYTTPGMISSGQAPAQVGGAAVARTMKFQDAAGNEYEQGVDYAGNPVGNPFISKRADVGPLTGEQNTTIQNAATEAETANVNYGKVQDFIRRLSPTYTDPTTGKQVPNPNYTPIAGGLAGSAQDAWFKLTGDMNAGQRFRKEIENSVVLNQLESYKAGIGGRLTNTDVGILQNGVPIQGANGETVRKYLESYAKYQQGIAERAAVKSAYLQANRGDMSELRHDLTIGGVTYKGGQGITWDDVVHDRKGVPAAQGTSSQGAPSGGSGNINNNALAGVQAAARSGNQSAQNALRQRGYTW